MSHSVASKTRLIPGKEPGDFRILKPSCQRQDETFATPSSIPAVIFAGPANMNRPSLFALLFLLVTSLIAPLEAWSSEAPRARGYVQRRHLSSSRSFRTQLNAAAKEVDLETLKHELTEYLKKRKEAGADDRAKE